ncbi:thermonuclease family protein [Aureimonas sp. AU40]|uniref:thermonuclease family protein n=1 Tax=Aureimonas sp. AU40 TaxID=1637747 RepID=UPI0007813FD4|nr:thermonuclease family protein [Aureimonas sp. AU40]
MRLVCLVLFLGLTPALAADEETPPREIAGPVTARVIKVRDGDTVEVEAYIWPLQSVTVAVRLRNVDAPELRGQCEAERASAWQARERLAALVGDGPVQLRRISGDKYFGRVLADLSSPTEPDIATRLLREGLVDAYDGGRRRNWCATVGALKQTPPTRG